LAQSWFHQEQHPGALGDFTPSEREALRAVDPSIEGNARAVGHANTDYGSFVRQHGDETSDNMGVFPQSAWEAESGQHILNSTPVDVSGAKVVRTDHGLMPAPLLWAKVAWKLDDRPRRMALMVVEMIEDYRPYLGYLVPTIEPLLQEFRAQGLPVFFTNWARRPGDGLYNALDRANGFKGVATETNFEYTYKDCGLYPMKELMPTDDEIRKGHFIKSIHLDKFADLDPQTGKSILSEKLRAYGIDTLVLTGGWTDACIISTALDAVDTKNLDVLLVTDAIGTATSHQEAVLKTFELAFQEQRADTVLDYLQVHKGNLSYILPPMQKLPGFLAKFDTGLQPSKQDALPVLLLGGLGAAMAMAALAAAVVQARKLSLPHSDQFTREPLYEATELLEA